jgi:hypothetical protein
MPVQSWCGCNRRFGTAQQQRSATRRRFPIQTPHVVAGHVRAHARRPAGSSPRCPANGPSASCAGTPSSGSDTILGNTVTVIGAICKRRDATPITSPSRSCSGPMRYQPRRCA